MIFNPFDWYWVVAGSTTQVYSGKRGDYFPLSDAAYQAFLTAGNIATHIASEAELGEVLQPYTLRPTAAGVLDGYKQAFASKLTLEAAFKMLFNHENRIRAIERSLSLNGSPADLTAAQALSVVKAMM